MMGALSPVWAEPLTIISDSPDAKIYLNGVEIGTKSVSNYEVSPGQYYVKVMQGTEVPFAQIITIEPGKPKIIVAERWVPSETSVTNRESRLAEGRRLRKSKGNFGFGLETGVISGVSLRYLPNEQWGFNVTGFVANSESYSSSAFEGRVDYTLVNTVVSNAPASFYVSLGYGALNNDIHTDMTSVSVGADFSLLPPQNSPFSTFGLDVVRTFFSIDNMYINTELGLGFIKRSDGSYYNGSIGRIGMKFMF